MRHLFLLLSFIFITNSAFSQTNETFNANGVPIHYEIIGEGAPVILIHGYMSSFEHNWQYTTPALSKEFMVIGMDIRGHGNSGESHAQAYGDELFLDVKRLMDHLEIEKAHIAGYSLGGLITLKFAVEFPDRVQSIVIAGSGLRTEKEIAGMSNVLSSGLQKSETITGFFKNRYPAGLLSDKFLAQVSSNDKMVMTQLIKSIGALYVSEDEAQEIKVPVLAIAGEHDSALKSAYRLAKAVPQARVITIPNRHHLNAPKAPEFSQAIKDFLIKVDAKL